MEVFLGSQHAQTVHTPDGRDLTRGQHNSRRLLDDAAALARAQRLPSALMVAGLAADELGKHILVSSFFSREGTDHWRKFWRRFRDHTEKLGDALMSSWMGDLLTEDPPPSAKTFHQKRLAATYVDLGDNGAVRTPVSAVSQEDFDSAFESINRELQYCERVLGDAKPEQLATAFDSLRTKADELAPYIESLSTEAKMALVIGMRTGMSQDEAIEFAKATDSVFARSDHAESADDDQPGGQPAG
jgi:AbiV family abortive infection protein